MPNTGPRSPRPAANRSDGRKPGFSTKDYKKLQRDLSYEKRLRLFADRVIDERQEELEELETDNQELRDKLAAVEGKLRRAHDQILDLQPQSPQRTDITDSEAIEHFRDLFESTKRWVQNWMDPVTEALDDSSLEHKRPSGSPERLLGLVRPAARRWLLARETDDQHVVAVIMQYLKDTIFNTSFYCPLFSSEDGDKALQFIDQIATAMAGLSRGETQYCREWRSDALAAATSLPSFKERREQHLNAIAADLVVILSPLLLQEPLEPKKLHDSVCRSIIEPAARLAHRIQLAAAVYSVEWPASEDGSVDLACCERQYLSGGGRTGEAGSKYLFDLCPGLYVTDLKGGGRPRKALCRPVVLVHEDEREVKTSQTILSWLSLTLPESTS